MTPQPWVGPLGYTVIQIINNAPSISRHCSSYAISRPEEPKTDKNPVAGTPEGMFLGWGNNKERGVRPSDCAFLQISRLLVVNPKTRYTVNDALAHPFFQQYVVEEVRHFSPLRKFKVTEFFRPFHQD